VRQHDQEVSGDESARQDDNDDGRVDGARTFGNAQRAIGSPRLITMKTV
jgi:hypothetical protein